MYRYEYLAHYGTKNMQWYRRLYQNYDGSLTPLGRIHYGVGAARTKAVDSVKKAGKKLAEDRKAHKESVKRDRANVAEQRAKYKQEQAEKKAKYAQEQAEINRKKIEAYLLEEASKKSLDDVMAEMSNMRIASAKKRVERLIDKKQRVEELADLKRQEKEAKKSIKDAKKNDSKTLSLNEIKKMSDEELEERIRRVRKESELLSEQAKQSGSKSAGAKFLSDLGATAYNAVKETGKNVAKDYLEKKLRETLGISKANNSNKDVSKEIAALISRRKEEERRVQGYKNAGLSKKDIAKIMGLDEFAVQDLIYTSGAADQLSRSEQERRVKNYKNAGLTISEIADRTDYSESKVKDLLYTSGAMEVSKVDEKQGGSQGNNAKDKKKG